MPLHKKSRFYFSHFRALLGLSVLGVLFFGYVHPHTYTIAPSTEKEFGTDSITILKALDWLGVFVSFCVGIAAHWLHRRLDRKDWEVANDHTPES